MWGERIFTRGDSGGRKWERKLPKVWGERAHGAEFREEGVRKAAKLAFRRGNLFESGRRNSCNAKELLRIFQREA